MLFKKINDKININIILVLLPLFMKKILSFLLLTIFLAPYQSFALNDTGYYVVTAYYSPLPDQDFYLTWDYKSEKRLNGEGIAWASWKKVFSGMLAWPKTYEFWTKIYLEWLGIWEIADRWWAIVTAGNRWYSHDRIDVWVGYWDEWLKRALYWWKRTVKWEIVSKNTKVDIDYYDVLSPSWATNWLKNEKKNDIFSKSIWISSNTSDIKEIQTFFKDLWLYFWEIDGIYNKEIIDIIYDYQIEKDIISSSYDSGAWYWGKNTRDNFKKDYLNWVFDIEKIEEKEVIVKKEINTIFEKWVSTKDEIIELQKVLIDLWYYNWDLSGIYDDIIDSIYNYQIEKSIISNSYDLWAWYYGPSTRKNLKETYDKYVLNKEQIEKNKAIEEKRKQDLLDKYNEIKKISEKEVLDKVDEIWNVQFWDISVWVRNLQVKLKELGYFDYSDTAIFGELTKESILSFQIDVNLIQNENDLWAGIFWPKTKEVFISKLIEKELEIKLKSENIDTDELYVLLEEKI